MSKHHVVTMHTTDAKDRLWLTCSCGWHTETLKIAEGDDAAPLQIVLARQGHDHLAEVTKA